MILAAILSAGAVFSFSMFLLNIAFRSRTAVQNRLNTLVEKSTNVLNEELDKPFAERFVRPMLKKLIGALSPKAPRKELESETITKLARDLRLGGMTLGPSEFQMLQLISALFCTGLFVIPAFIVSIGLPAKVLIVLFGLVLGILVPRYYLKSRIKKRQEGIRYQLPDVMDLLSVSVEAGLGFDAALLHVCERSEGPFIEELMVVYREIRMGKPRREALKAMGERNNVEELKTFTGSMAQAEQLGIPIRNVLNAQSDQLRLRRRQRAEEKAMKAPIKMMIPLVVFIFPVLFIILMGPAVLKVMAAFMH